jgi:hypothetical protein
LQHLQHLHQQQQRPSQLLPAGCLCLCLLLLLPAGHPLGLVCWQPWLLLLLLLPPRHSGSVVTLCHPCMHLVSTPAHWDFEWLLDLPSGQPVVELMLSDTTASLAQHR